SRCGMTESSARLFSSIRSAGHLSWLVAAVARVAAPVAVAIFIASTAQSGSIASPPAQRFNGRDVTDEHWAPVLSLTDAKGRRHVLADHRGKAVLVAFGYTHCPDACPATLARLAQVRRLLGTDARQVQVLFVTIDPERDTAQMLGRYVQAFDPTFLALRGTDGETDAAATAFHADYEIMEHAGEVLVSHTVETYLVDPQGRMRVVLPDSLSAQQVAQDVREILAASANCKQPTA
ncbi:MAG TPA: SCO family protein, partial [Burkholderiaceae bacterium]